MSLGSRSLFDTINSWHVVSALPHEYCIALPMSFWLVSALLQEKEQYNQWWHYLAPSRILPCWRQRCAADQWEVSRINWLWRLFSTFWMRVEEHIWLAQNSQVRLIWITRRIFDIWKLRQHLHFLRSKEITVHNAHIQNCNWEAYKITRSVVIKRVLFPCISRSRCCVLILANFSTCWAPQANKNMLGRSCNKSEKLSKDKRP